MYVNIEEIFAMPPPLTFTNMYDSQVCAVEDIDIRDNRLLVRLFVCMSVGQSIRRSVGLHVCRSVGLSACGSADVSVPRCA